ncbi:MAG: repeat protein, partial [Planctomycetaceae bacterium]|nr:repeat protein [Planctomycetaceae bacterium]
ILGAVVSTELSQWPSALVSTNPWRLWLGGRQGQSLVNGSFDEVQTFNHVLSADDILKNYRAVADMDTDRDGLTDLDELRRGLSPRDPDTDGDGMADGWEVTHHLDPRSDDANGDPDDDKRKNIGEFLFGSDPHFSNIYSAAIDFDLVGVSTNKGVLINIDFGIENKARIQRGPAAAGIDANDQWIVWPRTGYMNPLRDASGTSSTLSMSSESSPVVITYHGFTNIDDPVSGGLCEPFLFLGCNCDKLCQMNISWFSPFDRGNIESYAARYPMENYSFGNGTTGPNQGNIDHGGWYPHTHPPTVPLPQKLPMPPPPSCGDLVACPTHDLCSIVYKFNHMVRDVSAAGIDPEAPYMNVPEFYKQSWMFDMANFAASGVGPMCDDYSTSSLDLTSAGSYSGTNSTNASQWWNADTYDARAQIVIGVPQGKSFRVYLYGGPDQTQDEQLISVANNRKTDTIRIPGGPFTGYVRGVNYVRFLVQPKNGVIELKWVHKNSSLSGMQIVELQPMQKPNARAHSLLITGPMIEWDPVPQALHYNVLRKGPGETSYSQIGTTSASSFQDYSVLPFGDDLGTYPRTYSYIVQATNELYSTKSTSVSANVQWTLVPGNSIGTYSHVEITNNQAPVLNSINPLTQAYERTPFTFGAAKIQAAASAFDFEGAALQFVITRIACGTLTWIQESNGVEVLEELTNDKIASEINSGTRLRIIRPDVIVRWTPPDGAKDDVVALKVRAFDGVSVSSSAVDLPVNVKPQTVLLWWGNYSYGMSGGGSPSLVPLQLGIRPWQGYSTPPPEELFAFDEFGYSKIPAPVSVDPGSAAQFSTNEYSPIVDGSLRNVIAMSGASRNAGPLGNRLALTTDGNVWTWGSGRYGQMPDGLSTSPNPANTNMLPWFNTREQPLVTRVAGMSNAVSIAGNGDYSLVALDDGSVWGWGPSIKGYPYHHWTQFTINSGFSETWSAPFWAHPFDQRQLSFFSEVIYTAEDWNSGLAGRLSPDNSIFAAVNKPVKIPGLENIVQVAASVFFSGALTADGKVYVWGEWAHVEAPGEATEIKLLSGINERVVQIVAGEWALLAVTESGKLYQWYHSHEPVAELFPGVANVKQIAAQHYNFLALLADGRVMQWGAMGIGNDSPRCELWQYRTYKEPYVVPNLKNIVSISTGFESAYATDAEGYLWAWGVDSYGIYGLDYRVTWGGILPNNMRMTRKPDRFQEEPLRIGTVKEVEMAKTFDMNGYASAIIRDVPQNLSAQPADHTVYLSWDTFAGMQQYVVQRAVTLQGPFLPVGTVVATPALERQTYVDYDAENFQEYFYRVAILINGQERLSDPVRVTPQPPPSIPIGLTATARSRQVRIKWPAKIAADSYRVWRSQTSESVGFTALITMMNQVKVENREMFVDDAYLTPGTTIWYRLQAINPAGESELSEAVSASANDGGPTPPSGVSAVASDTSVSLSWTAAVDTNGYASYLVYKAKASCGTNDTLNPADQTLKWEFVSHVAATNHYEITTGLRKGYCYAFAVSTVDDRGEGAKSIPAMARPGASTGFPNIVDIKKAVGPGSIYLKWQCQVDLFQVSAQSGTNGVTYPLCGGPYTHVFPKDNGIAELWLTDVPPGSYSFKIARITDSEAESEGTTISVTVSNEAPNRLYGYPVRPLLANSASNRVELSWWGTTQADATSAVDQFGDWRFIVLRQEIGVISEGFPCDNFVPVGDGKGLTFSDTNVVNGHTYQYRLVGITPELEVYQRNLGDSPGDTNGSITPAAIFGGSDTITLSALPLNGAVQLTWNSNNWSITDLSRVTVELFCARGPDERYDLLTNVTSDHVYLHDRLENGNTYYYKVRASHQNGDFLEKEISARPSDDQPLVAPQEFTAGMGVATLKMNWRDIASASAYKVQKWNTATSQYAPFSSVATPEFLDVLSGSNAVYRYRVNGISGGREGLSTDIRVQPLTWTWPTNSLPIPAPIVTRFDIQRQCPGASGWITIGMSIYMQYVDVRTECIDSAAAYRIVPIIDGTPDESLARIPVQIKAGDEFLKLPPESINTFVEGTDVNQHGEIIIRLLDFDSATNLASAVGFATPTNVMLHASISFAPSDPNVKLDHVEFYADGELLAELSQLPYDYTWRNPAGTISGRTYKLKVRVVDSLGRSKDSPVFYASVTNLPPLKAFMTSVNDLQVTAPGVPLSLSRSYNSQDPRVGLLGKGWKTPWDQAHVSVPNLADGWVSKRTIISAEPFDIQETNSHRVEVVLPGGGAEHFRLTPTYPTDSTSRQMGVAGINIGFLAADANDDFIYRLPFVFAPEADAMGNLAESHGATVLQVGGQDFLLDGYANTEVDVSLSRGEKVAFAPDSFLYTASDGSLYEFSQPLATGETNVNESCLISVSDRNGNKVSYNSSIVGSNRVFSGISHSNGRSLIWTNETISGTAYICVYDPIAQATSGAKPVLRYRVENDLLQEVQHLRSRDGSSQYDVTKYEYFQGLTGSAATINGMLKRVISSEGAILLENDYFGTSANDLPEYLGFLKLQKDVVGVSATLDHDADEATGDLTSTVSQSIPGSTDVAQSKVNYDSSGKPVTVTDEANQSTSMGYDEKGRLAFTQNEAGDYKGFDYDSKDRPIAVTDELGNQTQVRYGALDQPTDTIDAAGAGTHYEYYHYSYGHTANDPNPEGSLRSVRDAAGVTTEYAYDNHGQVLTESRIVPGNASAFQTSYEYYSSGDLKTVREPLWAGGANKLYTTDYTYDENGNRKTEKRYREVMARTSSGDTNGMALESVVSTYDYDAQGRLLSSTTSVETAASNDTLQTSSSHYNLAGRVDYTFDAYGRKTEMLYDVRGNLIETTYVDGAVTRTVYDGRGRAVWQQERCMATAGLTTAPATLTEYDSAGRVFAVKRYGSVTLQKTTATPKSEVQSVTDSQTQYRRSTAITSPPDQYTITVNGTVAADAFLSISRTVYDELGRVRYSMDTRGVVTGYNYDAVGRRTNVTVYTSYTVPGLTNNISPTNAHTDTAYGYDENGNQVWVSDTLGNRTDFEYDTMNRRTITRFPAVEGDGNLRRYRKTIYDALGRRTGEVDEAGVVTGFGYDVLGRLTAVTNDFKLNYPSTDTPVVTTYGYDAFGNETSQRDAEGRTTRFEYDALGRRTHRILPSGGLEDWPNNVSLERTIYSRVQVQSSPAVYALRKQVKDFRGRTNTFDFDILDRLIKTTPSDTDAEGHDIAATERTTVDYTYNGNGQRAQVVQSVGTTRTVRYAYDTLGRLRVKDSPEGTLSYDYESSGALSRISARYSYTGWGANPPYSFESLAAGTADTTRAEWNYRYDSLGRLQKVNPDSTNALATADATYSYTDVGNLNTTTYRNSLVTTYSYNKRNWLRNLETKNGAGTRVAFFDYDANGWQSQNRLSPTGQRRCVQETYGTAARTVTYGYDRLSRLLTENIVPTSSGPTGIVRYDRADPSATTQGYDLVGNRLSRRLIDDTGLAIAGVTETTQTYDQHDLISATDYTYDASGNTTRDLVGATYGYDAENRLIKRTGGTAN